MEDCKVIVAGGRDFDNYKLLEEALDGILYKCDKVTIISGEASGADTLGEMYGISKGYDIIRKPANWNKYGKAAGYIRNKEMAGIANSLVAFWDGESRGTSHMIDLARERELTIRIIIYDKVTRKFVNILYK